MTVRNADAAFVTPAFVATVGLTMVLLLMVANLMAVHYARGVLQAAAEEGARQGVSAGPGACEARVHAVIHDGLGAMAAGVGSTSCTISPAGAVVAVSASFDPWLPVMPGQVVDVHARSAGGCRSGAEPQDGC